MGVGGFAFFHSGFLSCPFPSWAVTHTSGNIDKQVPAGVFGDDDFLMVGLTGPDTILAVVAKGFARLGPKIFFTPLAEYFRELSRHNLASLEFKNACMW